MNNKQKRIGKRYLEVIRGKPTFVKILNDYFDADDGFEAISSPWAAISTRTQYVRDYEKRLIPMLNNNKPLAEYNDEDIRVALFALQEEYHYGEREMSHYRRLFWRVYEAGVVRCLYEDQIHWRDFGITGHSPKELRSERALKRRLIVQKRSFSMEEDFKLIQWFQGLDPQKVPGEAMGLLFMLFVPSRNNEAAAINFEDIRLLQNGTLPVAYIYKTTGINTNQLKASGKTANANRIIPLFDFFFDFLEKRKEFVKQQHEKGLLILPEGMNVGKLPIACRGDNYLVRCSSGDLSNYGRNLFRELNIKKGSLVESGRTLYASGEIKEADATTYLLRRNMATGLICCGFSETECQYLMGHDIESLVETRNYFTNEDVLKELKAKLDLHPYNQLLGNGAELDALIDLDANNLISPDEQCSIEVIKKINRVYKTHFIKEESKNAKKSN